LRKWNALHPESEENIKGISVKFNKYDRLAEMARMRREEQRQSDQEDQHEQEDDDEMWTEDMLKDLAKSREAAEAKLGAYAGPNVLTRRWKEEWRKLQPELAERLPWRSVVRRYTLTEDKESQDEEEEDSENAASADEVTASNSSKVKGFRNWTAKAKMDLLTLNKRIRRERPDLEPGSAAFNKQLLLEFQKAHPKCMESSRSIYAKVQSIEREDLDTLSATMSVKKIPSKAGRKKAGKVEIVGFEDWTLAMIKDFIACMDSARKKFAALKRKDEEVKVVNETADSVEGATEGCSRQQQSSGVKLVPLLLDEWRGIYPETEETVNTFLVRIKHLKQQKDAIKKRLSSAGLLPNNGQESNGQKEQERLQPHVEDQQQGNGVGEFKWHKSMIEDVIASRKRALQTKEEGMRKGKRLSFHQLWAREFKKIHPKSTFTSNNLSVHLWTWRKQQQRLGLADPMYDKTYSLADPTSNQATSRANASQGETTVYSGSGGWTPKLRSQLAELGRQVQRSLSDPDTPNEQKVMGFSNMLHDAWLKTHPKRTDTARALNMMYCRIIKEANGAGAPQEPPVVSIKSKVWTPKFNKVLRECVEQQNAKAPVSRFAFNQLVTAKWREILAGNKGTEVADDVVRRRIADLTSSGGGGERASGSAPRRKSEAQQKEDKPSKFTSAKPVAQKPSYNKTVIKHLFECYRRSLRRRRRCLMATTGGLRESHHPPSLSALVHEEFLKLHPQCKMTPTTLMARLYGWKKEVSEGKLEVTLDEEDTENQQESPQEDTPEVKVEANVDLSTTTPGIVYRTWSQQMMDDLLATRKTALNRKQMLLASGRSPQEVQLLDLWHEEFVRLHPGAFNISVKERELL